MRPGKTPDGTTIHDVRLSGHGEGYTSCHLSPGQIQVDLNASIALASVMDANAARFFALGAAENDRIKRFLYFFLALETQTHTTYQRIDHGAAARTLFAQAGAQKQCSLQLVERQMSSLRGLFDRFVWCVANVWDKLSDREVSEFKRLKRNRDELAHAKLAEVSHESAVTAERLARMVLQHGK